ncbi:hypothetical protein PCANC_05653 [Puccinia coronata f. sp. avenae]|uniref:Chaperone DnaJ C-terminal domain-containing protein n=1 Tax=Puccinia coronata f. sp. avenae TaxID=200324 RepID=A0A2N5VXV4_9BASI|nr:hypothetical protein PCANC_05653 [Puccinia coronata f. sp. avenae]
MSGKGDSKGDDRPSHKETKERFEKLFGKTRSGEGAGERAGLGSKKEVRFDDMVDGHGGIHVDLGGTNGRPGGSGDRRTAGADHDSRDEPARSSPRPPPQDTVKTLTLSLEELFLGGRKQLTLTRTLRNGRPEVVTRNLDVKAGWKAGTKIRYEGLGDEDQYGRAGGLVLVVAEAPHERFKREGDDLVYTHVVPLREALAGPEPAQDVTRGLVHLDGRPVVFSLPFIHPAGGPPISPGLHILVPHLGMPITRKLASRPSGDLRIIIAVRFPAWLDPSQILAARQL